MKVLHFCGSFLPDRGGSETYTSSLIRELGRRSVSSTVISGGEPVGNYIYGGVPVYRLGLRNGAFDDSTSGHGGFARRAIDVLRVVGPNIVHFHFIPESAITLLLPELHRSGIRTALTYHHPALTCQRGDMLRFGCQPCRGDLRVKLCHPCAANALGAPRLISHALALAPEGIQTRVAHALPRSRVKTAFALKGQLRRDIERRLAFIRALDCVFVLSDWSREQLIRNGISSNKVRLSRLGTHHDPPATAQRKRSNAEPLRGIFVGRMDKVKGLGLLAEAFAICPGIKLTIDVYGPVETLLPEVRKLMECKRLAGGLRLMGVLPDREVVNTMSQYDFAVVPSQFFETGPFVAIEAFQAGIPVVATDVPALSELIVHNKNGWLVPLHSAHRWADALRMLDANPELVCAWKQQLTWQRSMSDVADDVACCYADLVEGDNRVALG